MFSRSDALRPAALVLFAFLSLAMAGRASAVLVWDFDVSGDDGATADGWTDVQGFSAPSGSSPPIVAGGRSAATTSGGNASGDSPHPTLIFRSPGFYLDGSGDLFFDLAGGQGSGSSPGTLPTSSLGLPANSTSSGSGGVQGIGLRNSLTNDYVLTFQKPVNSDSWATYSWTAAQLAPYANDGIQYTVDLFDYLEGGWGHAEIDDVIVPGTFEAPVAVPEPAAGALLLLSAAGLAWNRKRQSRVANSRA